MKDSWEQEGFILKVKIPEGVAHEEVHKALFNMGYRWGYGGNTLVQGNVGSLFVSPEGKISWGTDTESGKSFFDAQDCPEFEVKKEVVTTYNIVKSREKVVVLGKTYYKDELEKRIANLKVAS